jgi:hypothetical protein
MQELTDQLQFAKSQIFIQQSKLEFLRKKLISSMILTAAFGISTTLLLGVNYA